MKPEALTRWTIENSAELYGIRNWGSGYFDISTNGNVVVKPNGRTGNTSLDLLDIVRELQAKDLNMPVLLRFSDILGAQVERLNQSFAQAIKDANYQGAYRGVYPIKVNQKKQVVSDIIDIGQTYHHGLEAGSKAELIATAACMKDPEAFIVCNGYKDEEFIDLALYTLKMGLPTIIVVEMPSEVDLILARSKALNVRPRLGVRAKLSTRAGGRWDKSGGDRSKFGLNAAQIIELVDKLRAAGHLDSLEMLHYHLGSQIPDIRRIRMALQEASRFYADLVHEGAPMGMLDIGGGLAVDYDGSRTNFHSSRNYSMREYAADVIEVIMNTLDETNVPHPTILSESGRATVAHHAVLLFNVLHVRRFAPLEPPSECPPGTSDMLENLLHVQETLSPRNAQEAYHDAVYYRDEIRAMFLRGNIPLRERAIAENLFWHTLCRIINTIENRKYIPEEMLKLEAATADIYYGNFSLFSSLPDSWAIDHLFPIMPIHRLNEFPSRQAVLADITCDSDGKVDTFIDLRDVRHSLALHELTDDDYYLGAFLVGAYQDTLGDMHNLLGDVNIIHAKVDDDGSLRFLHESPGDTVEEVLHAVEYDPAALMAQLQAKSDHAMSQNHISAEEQETILTAFADGMKGYTYFEK